MEVYARTLITHSTMIFIFSFLVQFMGADFCDEMRRLCTSVHLNDVERGKNRLKMNLLLAEENATDLFKRIGFQLQCTGKRQPFHELEEQINVSVAHYFPNSRVSIALSHLFLFIRRASVKVKS